MKNRHSRGLKAFFLTFIGLTLSGLTISSCQDLNLTIASNSTDSLTGKQKQAREVIRKSRIKTLWSDRFLAGEWKTRWQVGNEGSWGLKNIEIIKDPTGKFERVLRAKYPAGSASPTVFREGKAPLGGVQFYANLGILAKDSLHLSYYLRFSENFDFVKGGKLPGMYGGNGGSGGKIPDGTDGFSTRFMWRKKGEAEVYAYLPTSEVHGTSIGRGKWQFRPGVWHHIEQEVVLNQPGEDNGRIRVWLDGKQVLDEDDIVFRTVKNLKIAGIFFSTFFGGNDPSWATPKNVYIDFAEFSVVEPSKDSDDN